MRFALLSICIMSLITACGGKAGSSEKDCINTFSVKAGSQFGARINYGLCRELHSTDRDAARRRFLECAIPAAAGANSEFGVRVAMGECHRSN